MKYTFSFLIISIAVQACSAKLNVPENAETPTEMKKALPGEWEWVKTECCFMNIEVITPEDCNCSKTLIFTTDGQFERFEDDEQTESGNYEIKGGLDTHELTESDDTMVDFANGFPAIASIKNDTLTLDKSYMDLEKQYFIRK